MNILRIRGSGGQASRTFVGDVSCATNRRRTLHRVLRVVVAVAAVAGTVAVPLHLRAPVANAQTAGGARTMSMSTSVGLVDEDLVTVTWTGYTPGPGYLLQCQAGTTRWASCAEFTRMEVTTGADGTGSAEFRVQSGVQDAYLSSFTNSRISCFGATTVLACDLVLTECEFDVAADRTVRTPLDLVAPFPPAPPQRIGEVPHPPLIERPPTPPLPPPPPSPPVGPEVTAMGSSSFRLLTEEWVSGVREPPYSRLVDVTTLNSPSALDNLRPDRNPQVAVSVTQDFALSSQPMEGERLARLRAIGRDVVHIPLSLSALAVTTRASYSVFWRQRLNLTAANVAGVLLGKIGRWDDPSITAANGGCGLTAPIRPSVNNQPFAAIRGDQSASSLALTRWLQVRAPEVYNLGAREIFPTETTFSRSRNSDRELSIFLGRTDEDIGLPEGEAPTGFWRLGYVNLANARLQSLTVAALENTAGRFVLPTETSVALGAKDLEIAPDGTARTNWAAQPTDGAYPLVMVNYAVVPTTTTGAKADVIHDFVTYALSDTGQKRATELGFFPLSPELRAAAQRNLAKLATTANQPPVTTTTTTTPGSSSATTNEPAAGPAGASATPAGDAGAAPASPSGSSSEAAAAAGAGSTDASSSPSGSGGSSGTGGLTGSSDERAQQSATGVLAGATSPDPESEAEVRPIAGEPFGGSVFGLSIPFVFLLGCLAVALGRMEELVRFAHRVRGSLRHR